MAKKDNNINKRRLASSYVISMISTALVLICIGFIGILVLNAKKISDHYKESIGFDIYFEDEMKYADIQMIKKKLDAKPYVKSTKFIDKEQAAQVLFEEMGEDFIDALGFNPLKASIDVKMKAKYANPDSLTFIIKEFEDYPQVHEVHYDKSLVHVVNENVRIISLIILIPSALLFLIAIALINNTIRLSIYSKRFIIRTMQLVGASANFIRKPFLFRSAMHGIYSGLLAALMIALIIYFGQNMLQGIVGFEDIKILAILFSGIVAIGLLISWISTYFAVNKYLRMKVDNLYY